MIGFNRPCTVYCPFVSGTDLRDVSVLGGIDELEFPLAECKG